MGPLGAARERRAAEVRELREGLDRAMDLRAVVRRSAAAAAAAAAGPAGPASPPPPAAGAAAVVLAQERLEREVRECFASGEGARGVRRALELQERFQSHVSLTAPPRKPRSSCSDALWQEELERLWSSAKGRPDWSDARLLAFLMGSRMPLSQGVSPLCHLPRDIVTRMVMARQS